MLKTQLANCQVGKPTIDFFKMSAYNLDEIQRQQSLLNSNINELTTFVLIMRLRQLNSS